MKPQKTEAGKGQMVMNPSARILTASVAVLSCLVLLWVYTSIESFAASNDQSAFKSILPVWVTDYETVTEPPDDETPTPTLLPTESSASLENVEMAIDSSTSELIEAAYKDPVAQEPKKPGNTARRDTPLPNASGNSASHPGNYTSLPKVAPPSTTSPSSGNAITVPQEDPWAGSTDPANGVPAQPVPIQTSPPDIPEVTEASSQPPPDLPAGTETSTQAPQDLPTGTETSTQSPQILPTDEETPSQTPTPPETITPSDLPSDQPPVTDD